MPGLYYEPESLKALLCVRGRRMLHRYCDERRVPHRRCGKLVVATDPSEDSYLGHLLQRAEKNGVEEIELIGAARLKSLEPHIRGTSALLSPCSGIVDTHALMLSYQADAEAAGATIVFRTPVLAATMVGRTMQPGPADANPRSLRLISWSTPPASTPGTSQPALPGLIARLSRQNFLPR